MNSNKEVSCVENNIIKSHFDLQSYHFYTLENNIEKKKFLIYCSPVKQSYNYYNVTNLLSNGITIGGGDKDTISYKLLSKNCATIKQEGNKVFIIDNGCQYGIYVNKARVRKSKEIKMGDVIFLMGLQLFWCCQPVEAGINIYLAVNNRDISSILVNNVAPINLIYKNDEFHEDDEEIEYPIYEEKDYFYRTPRFINHLTDVQVNLDAPPSKVEDPERSAILTVGPMLTMAMTSMITGFTAISNLTSGQTTLTRALPSLIMCGTMLASTLLWPTLSRKYQARQRKKKEKLRQKKYSAYIEEKRAFIIETKRKQAEILKNSFPTTKYCEEVILNRYTNLWQKRLEDEDYLKVNLGIGDFPAAININYPGEHFTMNEDNLRELVEKVGSEPKILTGVPIVLPLLKDFICGFVGEETIISDYVSRLLIQILAFHSYEDLKLVVFTDEEKAHHWNFLKDCPHLFTDDRSLRFFATNNDEYKEVCYYLSRVLQNRKETIKNGKPDIPELGKVYLVLTDNFKRVRDFDFFDDVLEEKENYGFCLMILAEKMIYLPEQCKDFVSVSGETGELHNDENFINGIKFNTDLNVNIDFDSCIKRLANIPIEIDSDDEGHLPNKIGFLEMYDIGKVEQFNSLSRWVSNNPILNLSVPVGVGKSGELINIDLHEKYHGPHGLIAGMTGSGKSEFIITYILSMAVNYHPYEVQFVLIDYKGGGLAGAFENKVTGQKLPHLVGTITNLDANEINRSLASIESELKRRQALFNKARELSGESTVDIYKYQRMYRDGTLEEPVSHLFIISDEFAELKTQQPDFMAQLISTARIGRSLGVHLILATQKPAGVVDSQIWSNTRFRVCLRVQEKSDSNDVIKCPDAALLKQTGRFYFQVGYNEIFVLGQASYAGGKYYPEETVKKTLDTSINFINNISYVVKSVETRPKGEKVQAQGEELGSIVKYLDKLADSQNIKCRPLWLDKIPDNIRVEEVASKYNYQSEKFVINPIIGEYDIPFNQEQKLLTVPISEEGNVLLYGAPGTGKENFITTLLYASSLYYSAQEVNYYIIDFGSGALKSFRKNPIVGDILDSDEEDKISNLYKMVDAEIQRRKELFIDYNGSYYDYCKNSGKNVPTIVVIINNYESYNEIFPIFEDILITLTREGSRYGIYFMVAMNTPNGIRLKIKQNFSLVYSLQQNNEDDYFSILGNVRKTYPSKIFGRGIIRKDDVIYEFQTALVTDKENITQFIKEKSEQLLKTSLFMANKVPSLPKIVTYEDVKNEFNKDNSLIVGIDKDDLEIIKYNFEKRYCSLITAMDITIMPPFVNPLIEQILAKGNDGLSVINCETEDFLIEHKNIEKYSYYDSNFDEVFEHINQTISEQYAQYKFNNFDKSSIKMDKHQYCIIIGLDTFKNKLSIENQPKMAEMFKNAKDLDIYTFIFVDTIDKFKKFEYEDWYKNCIDSSWGIWLGDGINDQYSLKVSHKIAAMRKEVPPGFCFVVRKGRPRFVKFVEKFEPDDLPKEEKEELIDTIEQIDI